jgi:ribosomal-protein-alanine N-acetyltransferase
MSLTVDVDNAPAIRLYKDKFGFRTIKREDHEYGKNEHRYEMELEFA